MTKNTNWEVGTAKKEITAFVKKCGMLGYGRHFHYIEGQETPQYARAYYIRQGSRVLAFVNAEFCFSTNYLRWGIVAKLQEQYPHLGIEEENLMITAQHTHSTAGGYGQHLIYNMATPGFQEDVFEIYRDGIVAALVAAAATCKSRKLLYSKGSFDKDAEVCFNRSIQAFNKNPELAASGKISKKKRHLACDREMKMLRFLDQEGQCHESINWFGVHTTSVSNRKKNICYDNKGYAAEFVEEAQKGIHAFAQDACGDVSPNFVWRARYRSYTGPHKDDYENAAWNGKLQADKAKELLQSPEGKELGGSIDCIQAYFDLSKVQISDTYNEGHRKASTVGAAMGMAFLQGTTDGQGAHPILRKFVDGLFHPLKRVDLLLARRKDPELYRDMLQFYAQQKPKTVVMDLSRGRVLGSGSPEKLILPDFVDPLIKYLKIVHRAGQGARTPWVPQILPLQIFLIGQLALVGIAAEVTTVAAQRLRASIAQALAPRGIEEVQLCPYANAYAGYITTREEYLQQAYEGGHTLFGQWTLAAYQTCFDQLCQTLVLDKKKGTGCEAERFDKSEIWMGLEDESQRVL